MGGSGGAEEFEKKREVRDPVLVSGVLIVFGDCTVSCFEIIPILRGELM